MRVNVLVPVDVAAKTIDEARATIRVAVGEVENDDRDDWSYEARELATALEDAVSSATEGSASFPTPSDIERKRLALIEPDVSALLDKIEASLITGEATASCSGITKTVRQEVTKRLIASGWTATFMDDPRGDGTAIAVVPSVATP